MMDVYSWWAQAHFEPDQWEVAEAAWQAATLAERERCAKVCAALSLKISLSGSYSLVEGWERFREQAIYAINNP